MTKHKKNRASGIIMIILFIILAAMIIFGRIYRQNRIRLFRIENRNESSR